MTLEEFLKNYYQVAMRIAKTDEIFNECLVLKFTEFLDAYNGMGDPGGYILMRLRYAVLKYLYQERLFQKRFGADITFDPSSRCEAEPVPDLEAAIDSLDPDLFLVIEMWANGYTQHDIAPGLGLSIRKVRARTNAAIEALRRELTDALSTQLD